MIKLRTCYTLHKCMLCNKDILCGEQYYDGGYSKRIHKKCFEIPQKISNKDLNDLLKKAIKVTKNT